MLDVAIVGGSGYLGLELLRILAVHPEVKVKAVTSREMEGRKLVRVFPSLAGQLNGLDDLVFVAPDPDKLVDQAEFFFTAVPHRTAMEIVPSLLAGGKVADLSADFRYNDPAVYEEWYEPHQAPELLADSVYGLPELYRDKIKSASLVGVPGCYPTSIILALAPLVKSGIVETKGLVADSKSGVSGAGRGLSLATHFCEANDAVAAYKVTGHRHTSEIEQELGLMAGEPIVISFTPHLVPMSRGILSTIYARLKDKKTAQEVQAIFTDFYGSEKFIRVRPLGESPSTLEVRGTNFCDLAVFVDERTGMVKVLSAIDNLTRGGAGQAVCNMNLMQGLAEETGLMSLGLRP